MRKRSLEVPGTDLIDNRSDRRLVVSVGNTHAIAPPYAGARHSQAARITLPHHVHHVRYSTFEVPRSTFTNAVERVEASM